MQVNDGRLPIDNSWVERQKMRVAVGNKKLALCRFTSRGRSPCDTRIDWGGVCLPFVYARDTSPKQVIFDIRRHQLVRLESRVGRKVWQRMRRACKQVQLPRR